MSSQLEDEAVAFARELIRIESVNTGNPATIGDGETRAARLIRDRLREVGVEGELVEPAPGRGSFIARIPGSDPDADALLVHAHLDVVPATGQRWTHPPFGAEIHDGPHGPMLYGRGALDMKGFAGTMVAVLRHFAREGIVPRRDLVVAFLADEEHGGGLGAGWLVRHRPELFAGVSEALGEVGGFSVPLTDGGPRAYLVATSEKGAAGVRLTARGVAGHASLPGDTNPVVALARAVTRIGEHRFPVVRTPATAAFLEAFGRARGLSFSEETLEADLAKLGFIAPLIDSGLRSSATPTVLASGEKSNVVPAVARARVDVRILPGQDEALHETLQDLAGGDAEVRTGVWWSASEAPIEAPLLDVLRAAIAAEDPDAVVVPYLLPASTDNKHFARLGIAGYGFVPLRVPHDFDVFGLLHAADERVPVDSLRFCARVASEILRSA